MVRYCAAIYNLELHNISILQFFHAIPYHTILHSNDESDGKSDDSLSLMPDRAIKERWGAPQIVANMHGTRMEQVRNG